MDKIHSGLKSPVGWQRVKEENLSPQFQRTIRTPEIIRSPDYKSNKAIQKSKDKKRHHRDKSKEKDNMHYKFQREGSRENIEKDMTKVNKILGKRKVINILNTIKVKKRILGKRKV